MRFFLFHPSTHTSNYMIIPAPQNYLQEGDNIFCKPVIAPGSLYSNNVV